MTSQPSAGRYQRILPPLFLLFCFGGAFYTYYKPMLSWISCPDGPISREEVCTSECLTALEENLTHTMNNTRIVNYPLLKKQRITTRPVVIEEIEENQDILMLIWSWPFGVKFDVKACSSKFGINGCKITDDQSQYGKAHGVMFHHRNIGSDFTNLQKTPRPPYQKWVWMNMESPDSSGQPEVRLDDVFNLTSNYRRDSDVWVPYGRIIEASETDKIFKIPPKDKLVCWIVSHWNPNFRRVKYFNELRQFIQIEAYGRHFGKYVSHEEYNKILSSCKFYLSFENSIRKDYITEKVFNPMIVGTVPVVLGPPRENYEEFIPADSFIHVDDFRSPKELAERLKYLHQNQEVYELYFTWRQFFTAQGTYFGLEHACRVVII